MRNRAARSRVSGQALVEFALVFPVFMLLVFGFIELGRLVYTDNVLSQGAREGARVATVEAAYIGKTGDGCLVSTVAAPVQIDPSGGQPGAHVCPQDVNALQNDALLAARNTVAKLGGTILGGVIASNKFSVWCDAYGPSPSKTPQPVTTCNPANGKNGTLNFVSIRIDYDYSPLLPLVGKVGRSASATMVIN